MNKMDSDTHYEDITNISDRVDHVDHVYLTPVPRQAMHFDTEPTKHHYEGSLYGDRDFYDATPKVKYGSRGLHTRFTPGNYGQYSGQGPRRRCNGRTAMYVLQSLMLLLLAAILYFIVQAYMPSDLVGPKCEKIYVRDSDNSTGTSTPTASKSLWTNWSPWGQCDPTCGSGTKMRHRQCSGEYCGAGHSVEYKTCVTNCTQRTPEWSSWEPWGSCSSSCGSGLKIRSRQCVVPTHNQHKCDGNVTQTQTCNVAKCQTDTSSDMSDTTIRDCGRVVGDGIYEINTALPGDPAVMTPVNCDNGWMVILRRQDGSVNFTRNHMEYRRGFGNIEEEFWPGLDMLANITSIDFKTYRLRVDIENYDGVKGFAVYNTFSVGTSTTDYQLQVTGYSSASTLGDSLATHNNLKFSTYDHDVDASTRHCSTRYGGVGFWFNNCHQALPTGTYGQFPQVEAGQGITWAKNYGGERFAKKCVWSIRPFIY